MILPNPRGNRSSAREAFSPDRSLNTQYSNIVQNARKNIVSTQATELEVRNAEEKVTRVQARNISLLDESYYQVTQHNRILREIIDVINGMNNDDRLGLPRLPRPRRLAPALGSKERRYGPTRERKARDRLNRIKSKGLNIQSSRGTPNTPSASPRRFPYVTTALAALTGGVLGGLFSRFQTELINRIIPGAVSEEERNRRIALNAAIGASVGAGFIGSEYAIRRAAASVFAQRYLPNISAFLRRNAAGSILIAVGAVQVYRRLSEGDNAGAAITAGSTALSAVGSRAISSGYPPAVVTGAAALFGAFALEMINVRRDMILTVYEVVHGVSYFSDTSPLRDQQYATIERELDRLIAEYHEREAAQAEAELERLEREYNERLNRENPAIAAEQDPQRRAILIELHRTQQRLDRAPENSGQARAAAEALQNIQNRLNQYDQQKNTQTSEGAAQAFENMDRSLGETDAFRQIQTISNARMSDIASQVFENMDLALGETEAFRASRDRPVRSNRRNRNIQNISFNEVTALNEFISPYERDTLEFEKLTFDADKIIFEGDISQNQDAGGSASPIRLASLGGDSGSQFSTGGGNLTAPPVGFGDFGSGIITQTPPGAIESGVPFGGETVAPATMPQREGSATNGSAAEAMQFFTSQGWTVAQAAGIVGNLHAETGGTFNPNAYNRNEDAHGIAQWRGSRLELFRRKYGRELRDSSFQDQLAFVQYELMNTERRAGERLRQATTPAEAAAVVDQFYERSAGIHRQIRIDKANFYAGQSGSAQIQQSTSQSGENINNESRNSQIRREQIQRRQTSGSTPVSSSMMKTPEINQGRTTAADANDVSLRTRFAQLSQMEISYG